jgi:Spherulation-specific family 4
MKIILTMVLLVLCLSDVSAQLVMEQQNAVPAYFYPGSESWTRMITALAGAGMIIVNPLNGPGNTKKTEYASAIMAAHRAGIKVLGYVDTGYLGAVEGRRTRRGYSDALSWQMQIQDDVDKWYRLYGADGIDGVFFDDVVNTCGKNSNNVRLYAEIRGYAKKSRPGAYVVANPGANVPQCLEGIADTLLTYEGDYHCYVADASCSSQAGYTSNGWTPKDARKIWHVVYGVPASKFESLITLSKSRGAGYIFVTDQIGAPGNPYAALPSYFSVEVADVRGTRPTAK